MVKILISGCNGHMGRVVADICKARSDVEVVGGFDILGQGDGSFPVWSNPAQCTVEANAVIDFSSPAALENLLTFGKEKHVPLVLATTGYSEEQLAAIDAASKEVPIFRSANMSLGVNVLMELVKRCASLLGEDYDVEIVERHHNRKVDAPSGTALMLYEAAAQGLPYQPNPVYDRHAVRQRRDPHDIGISAVRGGNIVGDHEVIFAGRDEVVELKHSAMSREVFASGAVKAACYLAGVNEPGLYNMNDLVSAVV